MDWKWIVIVLAFICLVGVAVAWVSHAEVHEARAQAEMNRARAEAEMRRAEEMMKELHLQLEHSGNDR